MRNCAKLESILFTSINEVQRLRSIVLQQREQLCSINQTAQPQATSSNTSKTAEVDKTRTPVFECVNCSNTFKRKYSLKVHQKFHCAKNVVKAIRSERCQTCEEKYTYNGLRAHLPGMAKAGEEGRTKRGKHANFNAQYHYKYLDEINMKNR